MKLFPTVASPGPRHLRIVYLLTFLALLAVVTFLATDSFRIPTGDRAIWLHSGLLMIVVGSFWIEQYFTKPADAIINALVVYISVSTLSNPPLSAWWDALRLLSFILIVLGFVVIWFGSPAVAEYDTSTFKRFTYLVVTRVGASKVIFSAVFILSLLSYFDLKSSETKILVAFWGVLLVVKHLDVDEAILAALAARKLAKGPPIGLISKVVDPAVVRFHLLDGAECRRGSIVALTASGLTKESSPLALVVSNRTAPGAIESEALIIDGALTEGRLEENRVVVKIDSRSPAIISRLAGNALYRRAASLVGITARNTDIARLYTELVRTPQIEEGHLVLVPLKDGRDLLFQVINGRITLENSLEESSRAFTVSEAEQVGTWNDERQGFETHSWVVPENSPVFHLGSEPPIQVEERPRTVTVGFVPKSSYPVNVNIDDLVLFHSALLGVTGSGKSFLAFSLIEACAASGVKVICLDVTGDYKRYLRNAVLLRNQTAIRTFLDGTEYFIGIVEFSEGNVHPIRATKNIAELALEWAEENRKAEDFREPRPQALIVLEEAHTLVPEWNSNPQRDLQDIVTRTAQIALQARKFGLGFMVISQRTANVTKSILNQCNTIVAFQAYDETGFDFLKNYMGTHYVQALPTLKRRQGLLVGKASASERPLIVRFHDQERDVADHPLPELPLPGTPVG